MHVAHDHLERFKLQGIAPRFHAAFVLVLPPAQCDIIVRVPVFRNPGQILQVLLHRVPARKLLDPVSRRQLHESVGHELPRGAVSSEFPVGVDVLNQGFRSFCELREGVLLPRLPAQRQRLKFHARRGFAAVLHLVSLRPALRVGDRRDIALNGPLRNPQLIRQGGVGLLPIAPRNLHAGPHPVHQLRLLRILLRVRPAIQPPICRLVPLSFLGGLFPGNAV